MNAQRIFMDVRLPALTHMAALNVTAYLDLNQIQVTLPSV